MLLAFVMTVQTASMSGQVGASVDIYQNLVGHWKGTTESVKDGTLSRYGVELEVMEEAKKGRVRMTYTYLDPKPSIDIRTLKLLPKDERMERTFQHENTEDYSTTGLKEFAVTGSGDFTAVLVCSPGDEPCQPLRAMFHIGEGDFRYNWQRSGDGGKTYQTYSTWSFHK